MRLCSRCGREVPLDARFCAGCGSAISSLSELPTEVASAPASRHRSATPSNLGRIESSAGGDFVPGQVLADRYRVIGLLGRGGMGEVYRADDLELETPVALKFLPRALANRDDLLDRLRGEVRNARQVSHPNVCRVYDVGEIDGRPFMTMEYVDGEDLGTLLRRIGRLPRAKADQVARQMCAGLAAAHDRGVIHRDLKPSNIMLDGDGRVRITDFGLAVRGGEGAGEVAGTPAYMAPEQFDGLPATVQSDLYSLGLILYELHTGKRAIEADTWDQWKKKHHSTEPSSPSVIEADVDEAVSRAILRCLEKDPSRRPASALQLAASLPGGDPLAAALAAGETPSPQMVATAGGEGALAPARAWALLAGVIALVGTLVVLAPNSSDLGLAPMRFSRPVLEQRVRDIRRQLGWTDAPRDEWSEFARDYARMKYVADHEPSTIWRREFRDRGLPWLLRMRSSPRPLLPASAGSFPSGDDPPMSVTGMTLTEIDLEGRLRTFLGIPPERESAPPVVRPVDWSPLFTAAALDTAQFTEVAPTWIPPVPFDARTQWVRLDPHHALDSLTVVAAAWRGRPVAFGVIGPWTRAERDAPVPVVFSRTVANWVLGLLGIGLVIAGGFIARRHLQAGRGDTRGARRMLVTVALVAFALGLFASHHVTDARGELSMLERGAGEALLSGALIAFLYLAVEPFVRRHTPHLLIGWARLLEGRWRDPRVGRDVLVGALLGLVLAFLLAFSNALPSWIPLAHQTPVPMDPNALAGGTGVVVTILNDVLFAFRGGFTLFVAYFVLRMLVRNAVVAGVVLVAINTMLSFGAENWKLEAPFALLIGSVVAFAIVRFGLLTVLCTMCVFQFANAMPVLLDPASAASGAGFVLYGVVLAIALVAFRLSLGQRPVFQLSLDE